MPYMQSVSQPQSPFLPEKALTAGSEYSAAMPQHGSDSSDCPPADQRKNGNAGLRQRRHIFNKTKGGNGFCHGTEKLRSHRRCSDPDKGFVSGVSSGRQKTPAGRITQIRSADRDPHSQVIPGNRFKLQLFHFLVFHSYKKYEKPLYHI